jgi:hypothetical protein
MSSPGLAQTNSSQKTGVSERRPLWFISARARSAHWRSADSTQSDGVSSHLTR